MITTHTAARTIRGTTPAVLDQTGFRMADPQKYIKLIIIGDGSIGKTCLLDRFEKNEFTADIYMPTVFHNTSVDMAHPEKPGAIFKMHLWDTAGQEDFEEARKICYKGSHVIIMAFSIAEPDSLTNIRLKWTDETKSVGLKEVPVIICTD